MSKLNYLLKNLPDGICLMWENWSSKILILCNLEWLFIPVYKQIQLFIYIYFFKFLVTCDYSLFFILPWMEKWWAVSVVRLSGLCSCRLFGLWEYQDGFVFFIGLNETKINGSGGITVLLWGLGIALHGDPSASQDSFCGANTVWRLLGYGIFKIRSLSRLRLL